MTGYYYHYYCCYYERYSYVIAIVAGILLHYLRLVKLKPYRIQAAQCRQYLQTLRPNVGLFDVLGSVGEGQTSE